MSNKSTAHHCQPTSGGNPVRARLLDYAGRQGLGGRYYQLAEPEA